MPYHQSDESPGNALGIRQLGSPQGHRTKGPEDPADKPGPVHAVSAFWIVERVWLRKEFPGSVLVMDTPIAEQTTA